MKKIAFIINALDDGGAERVVQTLSNYLVNNKYEVYIILLGKEKQYYQLDDKVKIITLKSSFISKGLGKILFIPIQSLELHLLLNRLKIDRAISFLVRSNLVFSFTKFFSKRRKVIISERSFALFHYEKSSIKNKIMNFLIQFLYKKADIIIPISNGIKESLVKDYSLKRDKIYTIYNPQDINYIKNYDDVEIDFNFKRDSKYFITLGRLITLKDHEMMIKAFQKVNKLQPNTKLIILGDGNLKQRLEDLINSLDLNDKVYLLGFKNNPFAYLKRADIFVFSSKFEGFGNVLVEAMACGLPVISTDCPSGPSEILENDKYGILTKVGNIEELSEAMLVMLDDSNLEKYKQLSLKRAEDFDVSKITKEYLQMMEK